MKMKILILVAGIFLLIPFVQAKITLPSVISDNMVLQQNTEVTLWGWTTQVNESLEITASWDQKLIPVNALNSRWEVMIKTPSYGGPYTLTIKAHETIKISNVMIGEVWLASGQSNMEMPVDSIHKGFHGVVNREKVIASGENPAIRMFTVLKRTSDFPQDNCEGVWEVATPKTVKLFSATAYFFALKLNAELNIPIGIIHSSWGGTNAESWLRGELITDNKSLYNAYLKLFNPQKTWPVAPGARYNTMIHPLEKYTIRGAIWYQGESNRENANVYSEVMTKLIMSWRSVWGSEMPFYYAQIAPYTYDNGISSAYIRESQLQNLSVPNTGMAVTNDIGSLETIHPKQKREVGERLALWALAKNYNKKIVFSGPIYRSCEVVKNKIIVSFDYVGDGLKSNGKTLNCFQISGVDSVFVPANALIKGERIEVSSSRVKYPVAVRFAFSDIAEPNLFNSAGLPASAFRTDEW